MDGVRLGPDDRPNSELGMGGHHRAQGASDEWYTPPEVFQALGLSFDLDPCAPEGGVPWIPAREHFSLEQDGLSQLWHGRVWVNPPYGPATASWMRRLAAHGHGVGLAFARTDTRWFHDVAPTAHALCFLAGRLNFVPRDPSHVAANRTNSNAGAPSMLLAYGQDCAEALARAALGLVFSVRARPLVGQASLWEAGE